MEPAPRLRTPVRAFSACALNQTIGHGRWPIFRLTQLRYDVVSPSDREQVSHASRARAGRSRACQAKWADPWVHSERRRKRRRFCFSAVGNRPCRIGETDPATNPPCPHFQSESSRCEPVHTGIPGTSLWCLRRRVWDISRELKVADAGGRSGRFL